MLKATSSEITKSFVDIDINIVVRMKNIARIVSGLRLVTEVL